MAIEPKKPNEPDPLAILVGNSFKRLADCVPGESESFLIYGIKGSGKTQLCGTAGSRQVFINIGRGRATFDNPLFKSIVKEFNPIIVDLYEQWEKNGTHEYSTLFDQIWMAVQIAFEQYMDEFDWLMIDDSSELRRAAMNKSVEVNFDMNRSQTMVKAREKHDIIIPEINDFTTEMNFVEKLVVDCIDLCKKHKKHFVLTAHERITYNKPAKIGDPPTVRNIGPGFTGQTFPDAVPRHFDHCFRLELIGAGDQRKRRLYTEGSEMTMASTRWGGVFKTQEDNPNLSEFLNRIRTAKEPLLKGRK